MQPNGSDKGVNPPTEEALKEEHAVWMKNVRFLYDLVISQGQVWPSLTLQWLPGKEEVAGQGYVKHRLILGTHTSGAEQDYLLVAEAKLPLKEAEVDEEMREGSEGRPVVATENHITVTQKIAHEGEVNRARYMPQNPHIVATKSSESEVFLFDLSAHPAKPASTAAGCRPNSRLTGHTAEGFGLAWSPFHGGRLLSGSNDSTVCLWDTAGGGETQAASLTFTQHTASVNDVAWHQCEDHVFGSVSDDQTLLLWDARLPPDSAATASVKAHDDAINALAFHPSQPHLLVTGSSDKSVGLFDRRRLGQRLHALEGHTGEVYHVSWSPHTESALVSGGQDGKVHLWDLKRIGDEQGEEDAEDGPPELILVHSGHSSAVEDLGWCPDEPWMLASIDGDNILQIWQPTESIYQE